MPRVNGLITARLARYTTEEALNLPSLRHRLARARIISLRVRRSLEITTSYARRNSPPQLPVPGAERVLLLRVELQRPRTGLSNFSWAEFHRGLHDRGCPAGHRGR